LTQESHFAYVQIYGDVKDPSNPHNPHIPTHLHITHPL